MSKEAQMMEKEILEVINKQLPASSGILVKKRLEQADQLQEQVNELVKAKTDLEKNRNHWKGKAEKLKNEIKELEGYRERLDNIEKRERDFSVKEHVIRLEEAEKRANELAGIVQTVFKSPVYRSTISGIRNIPVGKYGTITDAYNHYEENSED